MMPKPCDPSPCMPFFPEHGHGSMPRSARMFSFISFSSPKRKAGSFNSHRSLAPSSSLASITEKPDSWFQQIHPMALITLRYLLRILLALSWILGRIPNPSTPFSELAPLRMPFSDPMLSKIPTLRPGIFLFLLREIGQGLPTNGFRLHSGLRPCLPFIAPGLRLSQAHTFVSQVS